MKLPATAAGINKTLKASMGIYILFTVQLSN